MDNILPDVSVIIAAYNVQDYIERSIRSALAQKNVRVQIIVVDDASTDGTATIASSINDPRLHIIRQTQNGGIGMARNAGITAAKAPWIAILDGDDEMEPERLDRLLTLAHQTKADIVVDNLEVVREKDGKRYPMFTAEDFGPNPFLDLVTFIRGNASFLGAKALGYIKPLLSTEFLHKHGLEYDADIRIGEDYMLMAEALASGAKCAIDPAMGYRYTVRKGSTSHRMTARDMERIIASDKKFLEKHPLTGLAAEAQNIRAAKAYEALRFSELVDAIKNKKTRLVLEILLKNPLIALHLGSAVRSRFARIFSINPQGADDTPLLAKIKRISWKKIQIRIVGLAYYYLKPHRVSFASPPVINGEFPKIYAAGRVSFGRKCGFRSQQFRQQIAALEGATLQIGNHSFLNDGVNICASTRVTIGDYAKIGDQVYIHDTDFHPVSPDTPVRAGPIHIGKNVWIGANSMVLAGVSIGDHSVIAAGSVVTRSIPSKCVAAGAPARVIKTFEAHDDWIRS